MDVLEQLAIQLNELRAKRWPLVRSMIDNEDPINNTIADAITMLENLFILLNMPEDGFHSLTPGDNNGDNK